MHRRGFLTSSLVPAAAISVGAEPLSAMHHVLSADGDPDMVQHCRRILEQNLLKAGERLVVATSHNYDREFIRGLLLAGSEIGAVGAHLAVLPYAGDEDWFGERVGITRGLTAWHWDLYASADLLIVATPDAGARERVRYASGVLPVLTSYTSKIGNHPYRTDFEFINREGSKTRWLKLSGSLDMQMRFFPTPERKNRTLKAASILQEGKEIRVTGRAGSDFRVRKEGRPGHAQYGIADVPGRWDNFMHGNVVVGPQEYTAEGVVVLEPGSLIRHFAQDSLLPRPWELQESLKLTFEGGYVTKAEGAKGERFETLLRSYDDKESFGIAHVGFGTHEKVRPDEGFYAANGMGVIPFSLGANYGHGLGGPALNYSGLGATTRKAPTHTHFVVFNQSFYCDGELLVKEGKLLLE